MGSPTPSSSQATLRPDLATVMEFNLEMDRLGFIGLRVLPVVETDLQSDNPGKIPLEQLLKGADLSRTPSGGYSRDNMKFDKWSYATEEYGREAVVTRRLARQYANYFDAETVAMMRARDIVLREQEKRAAALVYDTSVYTGSDYTTAATAVWSSLSSAKPVTDVRNAKFKVWNKTGLWPNVVIMNQKQFEYCRATAEVVDLIASSGAGSPTRAAQITKQMLAEVFAVDEVLVAGSAQDTADEGQARSISQIWGDGYCSVARIARGIDIQEPGLGRTFHWSDDGSVVGGAVETYYEEEVRADVVRVRHDVDEVLMYYQCAHLINTVLS